MQILLIEDEPSLRQLMQINLRREGFEVIACESAEEAHKLYIPGKYAVIIADVMLPGQSGFEFCERIKLLDSTAKIMFVSARGEVKDRVEGLKLGADDYLPKPFDLEEFMLRVIRLARQETISEEKDFRIGNFDFKPDSFLLSKDGVDFSLSKRESMLLKLLASKKDIALSRHEILEKVWFDEGASNTRMVDNAIVNLRKLIEENPKKPKHLISVRGVGYKLVY